jgi:8-oxo-dGTP pyrophosphatase MutT (NUDIX family)
MGVEGAGSVMFFSFKRASAAMRMPTSQGMTGDAPSWHTLAVAVKPEAAPVPAATLVLLRDRLPSGVEILLIRRHGGSKFAAGDHVFPGGKVETADSPPDGADWCRGLDEAAARRLLGLDDDPARAGERALGYWVGAVREAFEEVGVLLADAADGRPVAVAAPRFADYRRACQADHRAFWTMLREERLTLATDRIVYFAHWITPEERPLRFDTRFFAAPMPAGQEPEADAREIVDVCWLSPADAVAARARGEISLRLPTLRNLALFDDAASAADAIGRLNGRQVSMIRPRLVRDGAGQPERTLLPGDPGWY